MRGQELTIFVAILASALAGGACGPRSTGAGGDGGTNTNDASNIPMTDEDGDFIADLHEGRDSLIDTDGDGTPDYLDPDSDGDGIPDSVEAGDTDLDTPPRDSDGDGIPDFRDNDSDNDGIPDGEEDLNGNGVLDPGETDPYNPDTDGDGVSDLIEKVTGTDPRDPTDNPIAQGNFVFLVPYQRAPEPPEAELRFRTNISKVDLYFLEDISVSMQAELQAIHDNVVTILDELTCDPGEDNTSCNADCPVGCGNLSCEPGETALNCPKDCLGTCGDGVCLGSETPESCPADCPATCGDGVCDAAEEPASCPSDCTGTCGDGVCHAGEQPAITACIPNIWSGAGAFGTSSQNNPCGTSSNCDPNQNGSFVYNNLLNVQPDPATTQSVLPDWCWGAPCWEPGLAATFYTVTGMGSASATAAGFAVPPLAVPEPAACPYGYRGYPCFRPDSLPIILLIGDEPFRECYLPDGASLGDCVSSRMNTMTPRTFPVVSGAVNDLGAKVIGINAAASNAELTLDFETLALETGSVDGLGNPFVFNGLDASAGQAIADGIRELTSSLPLDMLPTAEDDPSDSVDAIAEFLDSLRTFTPGTPECIDWPNHQDTDLDGHDDEYLGVRAGLPVCWKIHVKQNDTVPATKDIQIFRAELHLWGNRVTLLDTRIIWFVVPPDVSGPIIN